MRNNTSLATYKPRSKKPKIQKFGSIPDVEVGRTFANRFAILFPSNTPISDSIAPDKNVLRRASTVLSFKASMGQNMERIPFVYRAHMKRTKIMEKLCALSFIYFLWLSLKALISPVPTLAREARKTRFLWVGQTLSLQPMLSALCFKIGKQQASRTPDLLKRQ